MSFLKKIFFKVINSNVLTNKIDLDLLQNRINEKIISKSLLSVELGTGSKIYPETKVFNFQNKIKNIKVGKGTHIRGELLIFGYGGSISIGNDCYIGEGSRIWSGDSIIIGNDVLISHNVNIVDADSHEISSVERAERYRELLKSGHWTDKGNILSKPIIIEDNAWISFGVIILKGVRIGKGSIVGAGSIVTKDVTDWTIVAGNPAKILREIPEER